MNPIVIIVLLVIALIAIFGLAKSIIRQLFSVNKLE